MSKRKRWEIVTGEEGIVSIPRGYTVTIPEMSGAQFFAHRKYQYWGKRRWAAEWVVTEQATGRAISPYFEKFTSRRKAVAATRARLRSLPPEVIERAMNDIKAAKQAMEGATR